MERVLIPPVEGPAKALGVKVSAAAGFHVVGPQQIEDFGTEVVSVFRRIVQENVFLPVAGSLEGRLQAQDLPGDHLFVVVLALRFLVKPAAGAADRSVLPVGKGVVVEKGDRGKTVLREKRRHLRHGGPPQVVVSLEDDLPAGQVVYKPEILPDAGQVHAPADVSAENADVLLPQTRKSLPELFDMVLPRRAEHVHRFVRGEAQVQVPDGVQRHP